MLYLIDSVEKSFSSNCSFPIKYAGHVNLKNMKPKLRYLALLVCSIMTKNKNKKNTIIPDIINNQSHIHHHLLPHHSRYHPKNPRLHHYAHFHTFFHYLNTHSHSSPFFLNWQRLWSVTPQYTCTLQDE